MKIFKEPIAPGPYGLLATLSIFLHCKFCHPSEDNSPLERIRIFYQDAEQKAEDHNIDAFTLSGK